MKKVSLLLLMTIALYAENMRSELVFDSESFECEHESAYGVTNNYSFFVAKHQINSDGPVILHYGTKVGLITEGYTADNGFGQAAENYGPVFEANIGLDYDLHNVQKLSFEGSRAKDDLHQQIENQIVVSYRYNF